MDFWYALAYIVISAIITASMLPKAQRKPPEAFEDIDFPQADEGTPQGVIFGDAWTEDWMVLAVGNYRTTEVSKDGQFAGYRYYFGLHAGIARAGNELLQIKVGDKTAWRGSVTTNSSITIEAYELFGGENGEGGVQGTLKVLFGGPTQTAPTEMAAVLGTPMPGFRRTFTCFFDGIMTMMTPYPKPWKFRARRHTAGWDGSVWYPEKVQISLVRAVSDAEIETGGILGAVVPYAGLQQVEMHQVIRPGGPGTPMTLTIEPSGTIVTTPLPPYLRTPATYDESGSPSEHLVEGRDYTRSGNVFTLVNYDPEAIGGTIKNWEGQYLEAVYYFDVVTADTGSITIHTPEGDKQGALIQAMNPAHIIYEAYTNREWGRGLPRDALDDDAFRAVADVLHGEGFGLCMRWNRKDTVQSFVQGVLDHIGGVIYPDRVTGKIKIKLIRNDYTRSSLPLFDVDNGLLEITEAAVSSGGSMVNQVKLTYRDPITNEDRVIGASNLAAVQSAGGAINSTSREFRGIPTPDLAAKVLKRELRVVSQSLRKFNIIVDRRGFSLVPGGVIRVQDLARNISSTVLRIGTIDYGSPTDGKIKIVAMQDVFGLPFKGFETSGPPEWVAPDPFAYQPTGGGAYSWSIEKDNWIVPCLQDGTPTGGLPITTQFIVIKGATRLLTGVTYSVVSSSGFSGIGLNASTGEIVITGITADNATIKVRATVNGLNFDRSLDAKKIRNGTVGTNGTTSYAVDILIYRQEATQPATPSGGSYKFNGDVFFPPAGWSRNLVTSSTVPSWASRYLFTSTDPNATIPGPSGTANFSGVKLLLHGDGTNGSTTFTDSSLSARSPSSVGSATISNAIATAFGGTSIRIPKSTPLVYAASADWNVNNDFTISIRAYELSTSSGSLISRRNAITATGWCLTTNNLRAVINGSWSDDQLTWTKPSLNAWHTYTLVRSGSTLTMFVDGAVVATKTGVTSMNDLTSQSLYIGQADAGSENRFDGYMEEVLFAPYAIWTAAFANPAAPFSTTPTGVVLAMYFLGTNGSTALTDSSAYAHTFTANGTPTISTARLIGGSTTLALNGTTDWISSADSNDWDLGSSDFEIEVQFSLNALPANFAGLVGKTLSSVNFGEYSLGVVSNGIIQFGATTGGNQTSTWNLCLVQSAVGAIVPNSVYHAVVNRVGNLFRLWLNGNLVASVTASGAVTNSTGRLTIGANKDDGSFKANGYIGPTLIRKNTVLYTQAFTPVFGINSVSGGWSTPVKVYQDGGSGSSGVSSAQVFIYKRSATVPSLPNANATYTWATGAVTGLTNGWTTTPPAGTDPMFISLATLTNTTAAATSTITPGQWAATQSLGSGGSAGANGFNSATVFLFQRTGSAVPPSVPSADVTYTFATGVASGLTNGWTQDLPATGGPFRWVTTGPALNVNATDTITSDDWSDVALLSQDGESSDAYEITLSPASLHPPANSVTGAVSNYSEMSTTAVLKRNGVAETGSWTLTAYAGPYGVVSVSGGVVTLVNIDDGVDSINVEIKFTRSGFPDKRISLLVSKIKIVGDGLNMLNSAAVYSGENPNSFWVNEQGFLFQSNGEIRKSSWRRYPGEPVGTGLLASFAGRSVDDYWFKPALAGAGSNFSIRIEKTGGSNARSNIEYGKLYPLNTDFFFMIEDSRSPVIYGIFFGRVSIVNNTTGLSTDIGSIQMLAGNPADPLN